MTNDDEEVLLGEEKSGKEKQRERERERG